MSEQRQAVKLKVEGFSFRYGDVEALRNVSLEASPNAILGIMGPTGSGKTTLLRSINRMNDLVPNARWEGRILLDGEDVYRPGVRVEQLRRRVGMVFALPVVLPMSIFDNVAYGPRLQGQGRGMVVEAVERSLRDAALWEEVAGRLKEPAARLSGGQQQRLALARVLALDPEVILLDEPCSGLDPISTLRIEEALKRLKQRYTIVLVTHNPRQAARACDQVAFLYLGQVVEAGPAGRVFTHPHRSETEQYISGRFG
ncbi:MAG: phosphate ABC transporter ATP-binding protein [Acetobacteraceae bacterium]|nr:phosphate ABC transporter ATP-binding protein [Acetobacteraceae bacterium]